MNRLRLALICLLALALPVQGYAAQTMIFCGPAHHQPADSGDHHHVMHDHVMHDHARAERADEITTDAGSALQVESKCSICASCCNPAAIVASIIPFNPLRFVVPDIAAHFEPLIGLIPGGLERPPRPSFA